MWFNDQYHPESDLFQSAFSSRERAIVAAFHQRFESVSDSFPDPLGRAADLQARPEWSDPGTWVTLVSGHMGNTRT